MAYMMYQSHPYAKTGDNYYMEPALGGFGGDTLRGIPSYLEPTLAGNEPGSGTFALLGLALVIVPIVAVVAVGRSVINRNLK